MSYALRSADCPELPRDWFDEQPFVDERPFCARRAAESFFATAEACAEGALPPIFRPIFFAQCILESRLTILPKVL